MTSLLMFFDGIMQETFIDKPKTQTLTNKLWYSITHPDLDRISINNFFGNFIPTIALSLLVYKSKITLKVFKLDIYNLALFYEIRIFFAVFDPVWNFI